MVTRLAPCDDRGASLSCCSHPAGGHSRSQLAKCFSVGKATDVDTDLSQDHQGGPHVNALDQGQVHAQRLEQRALRVEPHVIALAPTLARLDGTSLLPRPVGELDQFGLNLLVALADLTMMELVQLVGLPKLEEMFGPPCSLQRQGNLLLAALATLMAQFSQFIGITLAAEDGTDDRHAGQSCDVADNFWQLDIHLLQGFLHVLDMTGGVAHLHLPLPPVGTQSQHGTGRPKRSHQGTQTMCLLEWTSIPAPSGWTRFIAFPEVGTGTGNDR